LTTKWAKFGFETGKVFIARGANVVGDSVCVMQNDHYGDIFVTNETLLWAETKLHGGLERGTLVPRRGSEEAFNF